MKKNDSHNNVILINFKHKKKIICVCSLIGVQKLPFNSQFENTRISLNNKKCCLHLKRINNSCIMLRDIIFYLTISYSI